LKKGIIRNVSNNISAIPTPPSELKGLTEEKKARMAKIALKYWLMGPDELISPFDFIFESDCVGQVPLHSHHSEEFFFILSGEGIMQIGDEENLEIKPRDLIYTPPDVPHSIRPKHPGETIRCLCFGLRIQ